MPSVTYSALVPIGAPELSTGMPRELNRTHAELEMSLFELSLQAGACPMLCCVFVGVSFRAAPLPYAGLFIRRRRAHGAIPESVPARDVDERTVIHPGRRC